MGKVRDLTGQKFNRLTAIEYIGKGLGGSGHFWLWKCDCGSTKEIAWINVVYGNTKSCGCLNREVARDRQRTHGMSSTKVFTAWQGMKARCSPTSDDKRHYFDKGIRVCDQWADSFEEFYRHIGDPPTSKHTLDRIDGSKGYEPGNVRWATWKEQQNNRCYNVVLDTPDGKFTVAQFLRSF